MPEDVFAEFGQPLTTLGDRDEVVAGELPHLRGEADAAIGEQDLGLADAARVENDLPGRRVAGVVLVADAEITVADNGCGLPADLDWIIMRCLEKERDRRYSTGHDLAADAERFLRNEPLEAAPPSGWYRVRTMSSCAFGSAGASNGARIATQ